MPQRHAVEKFHDDEGLPIHFVDFVDGADVGVVQGGRGLGLALKTGKHLRVFGYVRGKKLQGDKAIEFDILSLVDDAHPATTKLLSNVVMRDGFADHCWETAFAEAC
jgi:hypothetical protein